MCQKYYSLVKHFNKRFSSYNLSILPGVIKEGLPSSTTTEEEVKKRSKAGGARNGHRNGKLQTVDRR